MVSAIPDKLIKGFNMFASIFMWSAAVFLVLFVVLPMFCMFLSAVFNIILVVIVLVYTIASYLVGMVDHFFRKLIH